MKTVQEEIKSIEAQFLEIERTSKILDLELESLRENDKRKKKETKQKKIFEITKRVDKLVPSNGILEAEKRVPNIHKLTETENLWENRVKSHAQAQAQSQSQSKAQSKAQAKEKLEPVKYKGLFLCCGSEINSTDEIDFNDI